MSVLAILILVFVLFPVFLIKIFEKAGIPGWKAIIPMLNYWEWNKMINKPIWWFLLLFVPFINIFMVFLMIVEIAKCFGKYDLLHQALAVIFPVIYLPYLGISKDEVYLIPSKRFKIKKSKTREWVDAIIFAVVAATIIRTFIFEAYTIPTSSMEKSLLVGDYLFVSKVAYGPKVPNTPIAFPFVHHTLPLTKFSKSYLEWIKLPYYRFPGFSPVKRYNAVVFNYPSGDTVVLQRQNEDYYQIVRNKEDEFKKQLGRRYKAGMGRDYIWKKYDVTARPADKRENYIKRCVALPGDTLEIIDKQLYINGEKAYNPPDKQFNYKITTQGKPFSRMELQAFLDDIGITEGLQIDRNTFLLPLSEDVAESVKKNPRIKSVKLNIKPKGEVYSPIFPHDPAHFRWNEDNFGPLVIPEAGATVKLSPENIALYKKIIDVYDNNDLKVEGNKIYINDEPADSYTFKQGYYWMMGDNRDNSADSRFWGFVPNDHIVGKAVFVWLSLDKNKGWFSGKIRWDKCFRAVR